MVSELLDMNVPVSARGFPESVTHPTGFHLGPVLVLV